MVKIMLDLKVQGRLMERWQGDRASGVPYESIDQMLDRIVTEYLDRRPAPRAAEGARGKVERFDAESCPCCMGEGEHDADCTFAEDAPNEYAWLALRWKISARFNALATRCEQAEAREEALRGKVEKLAKQLDPMCSCCAEMAMGLDGILK